jgi:hypothetical protein
MNNATINGSTVTDIKGYLETMVNGYEQIGHPAVMERFVLRNGKVFEAQPYTGKRGKPKQCFQNATHMHVGTYAEGYMWRESLPIAIHHAWRVKDGKVIDNTVDRPEERQYIGVELDADELFRELNRYKVYGVLDCGWELNWEFMFTRDPGLETIVNKIVGRLNLRKKK